MADSELHVERRGEGDPLLLVQGLGGHTSARPLALLDVLEVGCAHVFGFSMGGMVAQELALAAPRRLRTLTLAGMSAGTQSKATSGDVVQALTTAVSPRASRNSCASMPRPT